MVVSAFLWVAVAKRPAAGKVDELAASVRPYAALCGAEAIVLHSRIAHEATRLLCSSRPETAVRGPAHVCK